MKLGKTMFRAFCVLSFFAASLTCFADVFSANELWLYASYDEWYEQGDTVFGTKGSMWTFYIDSQQCVELNGHTYLPLVSNPMEYPTTRARRESSAEAHDRWYTIGIRREEGRVYANYDEYMEYLKYRYTHEPPYNFLYSYGNPEYIPYHLTDDGEIILYDYNMEAGDSYRHVEGYQDITVVSKDMVTLADGEHHRRLTLNNGLVLIEGLGCINSAGLLLDYLNPSQEYQQRFSYLNTFYEAGIETLSFKEGPIVVVNQGIVNTKSFSNRTTDSSFFDLQGRRLTTQPRRGLYIKDGKKMVVK